MGDPGAVVALGGLALLVLADLLERDGVDLRIAARGDERGHAADRVGATAVAGSHEEFGIGAHERDAHADGGAVGQHELGAMTELLDHAEQVVPAARVQPRRVRSQLVEDLVHLEGGEDRLDQDRHADRPARNPQLVLGALEDAVPQPGFEVRLELGQIEVRAAAGRLQRLVVAQQVQAEVKQRSRDRLPVDLEMAFEQMPAPRAHQQRRDLVVQRVGLLRRL